MLTFLDILLILCVVASFGGFVYQVKFRRTAGMWVAVLSSTLGMYLLSLIRSGAL